MAKLVQRHNEEKRTAKQIGCMPTFLHIFDRQQIFAGKRIHSAKRLPSSTNFGASPETVNSGESHEFSQSSPPEKMNSRRKPPVLKNSSSKSCTELHRLSLDSRATVSNTTIDGGDGNQRRSPSVIARLMGLESVSYSDQNAPQIAGKHALRRSASESRVPRDLVHPNYIDDNNFRLKQPNKSQKQSVKPTVRDDRSNVSDGESAYGEARTSTEFASVNFKSRSFCDSTDFYEERNQKTVRTHDDFEKKLKMRGMDERSSDPSTLKQILEVLQFKGLLHSTTYSNRDSHRSFVYDRNLHSDESSIVLLKPWRSSVSKVDYQRSVKDPRGTCRYVKDYRSERIPVRTRTSSRNRTESNLKSYNSISKSSPNRSVHHSMINRSPRSQKPTESSAINSPKQKFIKNVVTEDQLSSISDSIVGTPSTTDSERSKWEVCREEKSLLQRCDKLHHGVADMNCTTESPPSSVTVLPSPVSVLDSGFDEPEPSTPSHCINLKATPVVDFNDENDGSTKLSPANTTEHEEFTSNDSDFTYISHIIRSTQHLHKPSDVFFSIEKHLYNNTKNTSNASKRHQKLVFDVVLEILNRNRQFPPWKALIEDRRALLQHIWSEFQKIREINASDDLLELVIGALKKDIVEINGWRDYPIETSEAVLDIERMIFKDLVSEAIGDLARFSGECVFLRTRRKLVF